VAREQRADPFCRQIVRFLKYGKLPNKSKDARKVLLREEDYILIDDVLFHIYTPTKNNLKDSQAQIVAPQNLKASILKHHHDGDMAGHIGVTRMISIMRARFYWPGMIRDITNYVTTCRSCNAAKTSSRSIRPTLTIRQPAPGPFHTVIIDTVGPLPRSSNGDKHLVCVTDQYSRYVIAWPTVDITAKSIAKKFYEKVVCIYGAPKRILSDNGTGFTAALFKELARLLQIKQVFSPAYKPTSQGQVERAQRSLITLLRHFVNEKQTNWDQHLPQVVWALNTSENRPLGYSSYVLVFGRLPTFPSEMDLPDPLATDATTNEHLTKIVQMQAAASKFASDHLKEQQQSMKHRYDASATDNTIRTGDAVYVFEPRLRLRNTKKKLQKSFAGPYIVVSYTNPTSVQLKRLSDGKVLPKPVTISRLKKGHVRADTNQWDPLPNPGPPAELDVSDIPEADLTDVPAAPIQTVTDVPIAAGAPVITQTPQTFTQASTQDSDVSINQDFMGNTQDSLISTQGSMMTHSQPSNTPPLLVITPAMAPMASAGNESSQVQTREGVPAPGNPTPPTVYARRRNGVRAPVVQILGSKIDRLTGYRKFNLQFDKKQTEWVMSNDVDKAVRQLAHDMGLTTD
jgi:hypothetical protein